MKRGSTIPLPDEIHRFRWTRAPPRRVFLERCACAHADIDINRGQGRCGACFVIKPPLLSKVVNLLGGRNDVVPGPIRLLARFCFNFLPPWLRAWWWRRGCWHWSPATRAATPAFGRKWQINANRSIDRIGGRINKYWKYLSIPWIVQFMINLIFDLAIPWWNWFKFRFWFCSRMEFFYFQLEACWAC